MIDPRLRRLGYKSRTGSPSPIIGMLERAGARPRPMNRAYPAEGGWIANCPFGCKAEDVLYVERGITEWLATCGCATGGGLLELHARLLLQGMAA